MSPSNRTHTTYINIKLYQATFPMVVNAMRHCLVKQWRLNLVVNFWFSASFFYNNLFDCKLLISARFITPHRSQCEHTRVLSCWQVNVWVHLWFCLMFSTETHLCSRRGKNQPERTISSSTVASRSCPESTKQHARTAEVKHSTSNSTSFTSR